MTVLEYVTLLGQDCSLVFYWLVVLDAKMRAEVGIGILALLIYLTEAGVNIDDGRVGAPEDI